MTMLHRITLLRSAKCFHCRDGLLSTCRAFRERRHGDRLRARKIGLETDHGAAKICGDNQPNSWCAVTL
jgi:hypothetical protein